MGCALASMQAQWEGGRVSEGKHIYFPLLIWFHLSNRRSVFAYHVVKGRDSPCTATHLPVRPGRSASHQLMQRILRKNRCEVEQASETKQLRKTYLYRDVCTWKSKCKKKYALHNSCRSVSMLPASAILWNEVDLLMRYCNGTVKGLLGHGPRMVKCPYVR